MLYNKFNVTSSSPSDNPSQHPNSEYNCVVASTTGQWKVSRCTEQHRVVCQSDHDTLPGSSYYESTSSNSTLPVPISGCSLVLCSLVLCSGNYQTFVN